MSQLVSLGCNCHPAWWLRKLGLRARSMPFDWLLSKPHVGLDYAVTVYQNGFDAFLDDLSVNARGHPVAARYPNVELFHHHALTGDDPAARDDERRRLQERARDFIETMDREPPDLAYCYPLRDQLPRAEELAAFTRAVDRALAAWPRSVLHVYFMSDTPGLLGRPLLAPRERLVEHAYFRDQSIDKNWGTEPSFFRAVARPLPGPTSESRGEPR